MRKTILAAAVAAASLTWPGIQAQGPLPDFRELQWRNIGPHRASRTKALDGVLDMTPVEPVASKPEPPPEPVAPDLILD